MRDNVNSALHITHKSLVHNVAGEVQRQLQVRILIKQTIVAH